jgi:putative FmdB family regulatory protein
MPTYEYACRSCGEHLEVVQSFKDDPLTECPNCGGSLRKVFGNIGISFKGSGFYKTDSRAASSSSGRSSRSSEGGRSGGAESGGGSSSESSTSGSSAGGSGSGGSAPSSAKPASPPAAAAS